MSASLLPREIAGFVITVSHIWICARLTAGQKVFSHHCSSNRSRVFSQGQLIQTGLWSVFVKTWPSPRDVIRPRLLFSTLCSAQLRYSNEYEMWRLIYALTTSNGFRRCQEVAMQAFRSTVCAVKDVSVWSSNYLLCLCCFGGKVMERGFTDCGNVVM